jgi:RNA polymerase sigma factor (TIGR02999 family)
MRQDPSGEVTALLRHWIQGDERALSDLIPLVHQELRRIAHHHMHTERADHTLQSTALVNEAFLRLLGSKPVDLESRAHFLAVTSRLMRQVLVDYSRGRNAGKRDGGLRIEFEAVADLAVGEDRDVIALDDSLTELAAHSPRQAQIVEMKFFGGMLTSEIAQVLKISIATVERDWSTARIWLYRHMRNSAG